jgi:hypothetical protein
MHARARLPQKRIRTKKPARAAKQLAPAETTIPSPAVADLAAHRARRSRHAARPVTNEIYGLVEWIGPARDDWRRGELDVRRTACMAMTATRTGDGGVILADIPGHGAAWPIAAESLAALASGALPELVLTLPGLRITFTATALLAGLPAMPASAQLLAFPARRSA